VGLPMRPCMARCGAPAFRRLSPTPLRHERMTTSHEHDLPLAGIRVVEFTHMVMGPTCGMILADLGAEVIKVEPPGGDKTRNLPGVGIGYFRTFNRNKKNVVLDIETEAVRSAAVGRVKHSDILLENFRPDHMASD